jgi:hypothetical protein
VADPVSFPTRDELLAACTRALAGSLPEDAGALLRELESAMPVEEKTVVAPPPIRAEHAPAAGPGPAPHVERDLTPLAEAVGAALNAIETATPGGPRGVWAATHGTMAGGGGANLRLTIDSHPSGRFRDAHATLLNPSTLLLSRLGPALLHAFPDRGSVFAEAVRRRMPASASSLDGRMITTEAGGTLLELARTLATMATEIEKDEKGFFHWRVRETAAGLELVRVAFGSTEWWNLPADVAAATRA